MSLFESFGQEGGEITPETGLASVDVATCKQDRPDSQTGDFSAQINCK